MSVFIPVRKILSILFSLFIICLISIILIHIFQWSRQDKNFSIFGYQLLIERTYSIDDEVQVGDLLVMKGRDKYQVGDIISYQDSLDGIITSKVVDVDQDIYYVSSNEKQMSDTNKVFQDQVLGACVFVVPGLGNILLFLSSWMGLSTLFFIVLLLGGGYFVVRYLKHNFRGGESSEEE